MHCILTLHGFNMDDFKILQEIISEVLCTFIIYLVLKQDDHQRMFGKHNIKDQIIKRFQQ